MEEPNRNASHGNSDDPKDLFESLPDEFLDEFLFSVLLLLPPDLKFLTQSLLVSHRFAATILRLPAVQILLPPSTSYLASPDLELRSNLIKSSYASATNTLNKFVNLRSIHLLFPEEDPLMATAGYSYTKIKVEPDLYTFVFLQSNLKHKLNGNPDSVTMDGTGTPKYWSGMFFWQDYLMKLVRDYPMVENFKISSPNSLTEICVGGDELLRLKISMEEATEYIAQRFLRKLTLPEAGYVLEDVIFIVRQIFRREKLLLMNTNDKMEWDFGEDDEVFAEAMKLEMNEFNMLVAMHRDFQCMLMNIPGWLFEWNEIGQEVNWLRPSPEDLFANLNLDWL